MILHYTELVFEAQSLLGRGVINKGYFSETFLFKPLGTPTERFKKKAEEQSFI